MKANHPVIIISTLALFFALVFILWKTSYDDFNNILMVSAKQNSFSNISVEKLEEINTEKFRLTYEIPKDKMVSLLNSNHSITLKETNYSYPFVMNYNLISGGFFTYAAQEQNSNVVVLNELCAFQMFGSYDILGMELYIDNKLYKITGVINDMDTENQNIYIPASSNSVDSIMVSMKNDVSEEYIKNEFKQIGISETSFDFVNLDSLSWGFLARVIAAALVIAATTLISALKLAFIKFSSLRQNSKPLFILIAMSLYMAGLASTLVLSLSTIVKICLRFESYPNISTNAFADKIVFLQDMHLYSHICFIALAVLMVLVSLNIIVRQENI